MPLYVFKCAACDREQEVMQKFEDAYPYCSDEECHKASSKKGLATVTRVLGHTSFQLKGSGWYRDGYSSNKKVK
jgi:putative FmdB family regulatory protein